MKLQLISAIIVLMIAIGCGGGSKSGEAQTSESLLPSQLGENDLKRSSEIRTFVGQSLYEHINGGAEIYHLYGFVDVITAYYKKNESEVLIDIYRFENSDNAYGLYSTLRPDDPDLVVLGIEGFKSTTSIDFVKGSYVVRVIGFDENSETSQALTTAATEIAKTIKGETELPQQFGLLPDSGVVPFTQKIYAESFLGHRFLTDVYAQKYNADSDTALYMIISIAAEKKYRKWLEAAREPVILDMTGNECEGFMVSDGYYGDIVVVLKGQSLAAIIGYSEKQFDIWKSWDKFGDAAMRPLKFIE